MTAPRVRSLDGPRGGEYFVADLADGRMLSVSRKVADTRVWLGDPADLSTWAGQRGGVGTVDGLLDEWRSRLALDPAVVELYWTLNDLSNARKAQ